MTSEPVFNAIQYILTTAIGQIGASKSDSILSFGIGAKLGHN